MIVKVLPNSLPYLVPCHPIRNLNVQALAVHRTVVNEHEKLGGMAHVRNVVKSCSVDQTGRLVQLPRPKNR